MGSALLRQHRQDRQQSSRDEHVLSLARGRAQLIIWSGLSFAASENVRLHRRRYLPTLGEALPH